jgi:hypothetical protein
MSKLWAFYDDTGALRLTKEAYFYDNAGARKRVTEGYFYDSFGSRKKFFEPVIPYVDIIAPGILTATGAGQYSPSGVRSTASATASTHPMTGPLATPPAPANVTVAGTERQFQFTGTFDPTVGPSTSAHAFGYADNESDATLTSGLAGRILTPAVWMCWKQVAGGGSHERTGFFGAVDFGDGDGPRSALDSLYWYGLDNSGNAFEYWWWETLTNAMTRLQLLGAPAPFPFWSWIFGGAVRTVTTNVNGSNITLTGCLYAPSGSPYYSGGNGTIDSGGTPPAFVLRALHFSTSGNSPLLYVFTNETAAFQSMPRAQVTANRTVAFGADSAAGPLLMDSVGAWSGGWCYRTENPLSGYNPDNAAGNRTNSCRFQ